MIKPINKNTLFYGDNLPILQEYIPDESIDLIYLDPPFNSNRSYSVLFTDESGSMEGKKGSDKGIDGVINFLNEKGKTERVLIQVKSGHVKSGDIRDLRGVLEREESAIGVFITLEEPSRDMNTEAVSSGYYHSQTWGKDYPRIQILTVEELLNGKEIEMPPDSSRQTFKQTKRVKKTDSTQDPLL